MLDKKLAWISGAGQAVSLCLVGTSATSSLLAHRGWRMPMLVTNPQSKLDPNAEWARVCSYVHCCLSIRNVFNPLPFPWQVPEFPHLWRHRRFLLGAAGI